MLNHLSTERKNALKLYRHFIEDGAGKETIWKGLKGGFILGDHDFTAKTKNMVENKREIDEISRKERYVSRPPLAEIFKGNTGRAVRSKPLANAHHAYGYTLKEIAQHLGIHYSTVSKALKKDHDSE